MIKRRTAKTVKERVSYLEREVQQLRANQLIDINAKNPKLIALLVDQSLGRRSTNKILRNPEACRIALEMILEGDAYTDVAIKLSKIKKFKVSRTTVWRFWELIRLIGINKKNEIT